MVHDVLWQTKHKCVLPGTLSNTVSISDYIELQRARDLLAYCGLSQRWKKSSSDDPDISGLCRKLIRFICKRRTRGINLRFASEGRAMLRLFGMVQ